MQGSLPKVGGLCLEALMQWMAEMGQDCSIHIETPHLHELSRVRRGKREDISPATSCAPHRGGLAPRQGLLGPGC